MKVFEQIWLCRTTDTNIILLDLWQEDAHFSIHNRYYKYIKTMQSSLLSKHGFIVWKCNHVDRFAFNISSFFYLSIPAHSLWDVSINYIQVLLCYWNCLLHSNLIYIFAIIIVIIKFQFFSLPPFTHHVSTSETHFDKSYRAHAVWRVTKETTSSIQLFTHSIHCVVIVRAS